MDEQVQLISRRTIYCEPKNISLNRRISEYELTDLTVSRPFQNVVQLILTGDTSLFMIIEICHQCHQL